jgi:hypothetical protein
VGTQQNYNVTVTVDDRNLGTFSMMSGGEVTADVTKNFPGGMQPERAYGGPATTGDVTVTRVFERDRDAPELFHWLVGRVGKGQCTVSKQPLDRDGLAFVRPIVYQGILKGLTPGDANANSADVDNYDLVMTPQGTIS